MKSTLEYPFLPLRLIAWCLMKVGFALKIQGRQHLELVRGPIILAGNHVGFLDSLVLLASFNRYFRFVMDEKVFGWGFIGQLVRYGNILPINPRQPKASMACALEALRKGDAICIFPEGKLSVDGQLGAFQDGVAFLQEKSGATILPFAIGGGFEAWPYGRRWPRFYPMVIRFGKPIPADSSQSRQQRTSWLRECVAGLLTVARHPLWNKSNSSISEHQS